MITAMYSTILNQVAHHANFGADICSKHGQPQGCGFPTVDAGSGQLHDILSIVFAILAALAVLFIIIGALRMVTSQGNPQEASKARSTIIYALVGLLVALLAEAIVAFVLGNLK